MVILSKFRARVGRRSGVGYVLPKRSPCAIGAITDVPRDNMIVP